MPGELGPTRPDKLTIWPVEGGTFGIDVRWGGPEGHRRANVVRHQLEQAGIGGRLIQELDHGWTVRVGPVPQAEVTKVIDGFIW
jgi:hypothetical protein